MSSTRHNEKKNEPGLYRRFISWLVRGTVSEPWPTAKELFDDPNVQKRMKAVRDVFREKRWKV